MMQSFLISTCLVTLAEMGDKTQLLALLLAARFRQPLMIVCAILLATVLNHAIAAVVGQWLAQQVAPIFMHWLLAFSFIAMGLWMLIPDQLEDESAQLKRWQKYGVFVTTFVLFFLAEMGDKTQVATVALAARFDSIVAVLVGTTLGMMIANAPVVFIGDKMAHRLPIALIHRLAAAIFCVLGLVTLLQIWLS